MKDFHIHLKKGVTDYDVMKQYIDRCIELGIDEVIFLDHGNRTSPNHKPVLNNKKIIKEFLKLIDRARSEYKNITIHSGIETDYFPDKEKQDNEIGLMNSGFDYVVSSVHGVKYLNLDDTGYYKAMLDTVKKYPLNILAHLKLYDDYKEHDKIINQILKECKKKNVMMEINTSDRSIWNIEQLNYMLDLFKKYDIKYTIGSDAHKVGELGVNYDLMYSYLDNKINKEDREIEYNIVSRGTEKSGSKGYMAITKKINNSRYLIVQGHENKNITCFKDSLKCYDNDIETIAFSRFEMIGALSLNRINFKDDILLCGLGNIGIGVLVYLLDNNYKNIDIYTKDIKPYIKSMIRKLNKRYDSNIKLVDEIEEHETYIDTTGVSSVIEMIFKDIKTFKTIFLIGTPRESKYFIDPLLIHRNNLMVIGGHELRGVEKTDRVELFEKLLKVNSSNELIKQIVHINRYKKDIFENILKEKNHFIEVVKYDD